MNSLADSIYNANADTVVIVDPLINMLVERAISINKLEGKSSWSIFQLHLRKTGIWLGNRLVDETKNNLYWLTEYSDKVPEPLAIGFWKELKRRLPMLDRNIFQISAHLFWDRENGEILTDKQISDRFKVYDNNEKVPKTDKG